jgi:hypothetical protein
MIRGAAVRRAVLNEGGVPMRSWWSLAVVLVGCVGAAVDPGASVERADDLVYGTDDRREWYQLTDPAQRRAAESTAALFRFSALSRRRDGAITVRGASTYGATQNLCAEEPYRAQPDAAFCSGFLVAPDVIATAGHCVDSAQDCASIAFVFGYRMNSASAAGTTFPAGDVYFCRAVLGREETGTSDWALIRVDRAAANRTPLAVRRSGIVANNQPLVVMGHPSGIPLKVAGNATVRNNRPAAYFEANLDSYAGNSGSPVLDAQSLTVEGILVRGNEDFALDAARRCFRSNRCDDVAGCPGWEGVTRASRFASLIPR